MAISIFIALLVVLMGYLNSCILVCQFGSPHDESSYSPEDEPEDHQNLLLLPGNVSTDVLESWMGIHTLMV